MTLMQCSELGMPESHLANMRWCMNTCTQGDTYAYNVILVCTIGDASACQQAFQFVSCVMGIHAQSTYVCIPVLANMLQV